MCILFNIIHIFILTKFRCAVWIQKCNPINLPSVDPNVLHTNFRICSLHFEDKMFVNLEKSRLSKNAMPTLLKGEHKCLIVYPVLCML